MRLSVDVEIVELTHLVCVDFGSTDMEEIEALAEVKVIPYVAQSTSGKRSAVLEGIARTGGYSMAHQKRAFSEQAFGWAKTIGNMRRQCYGD